MKTSIKIFRHILPYSNKAKNILIVFIAILLSLSTKAQKKSIEEKFTIENKTYDSSKVINEMRISRDMHKKNPNDGNELLHANNAINYALTLNDTLLYARALDNLGLLNRFHKEYAQAMNLHIKAFELIKNLPVDPIYKMIFANNAGVAARYFEKYDVSVLYYLIALRIAEKENDLKNMAISSNGLGNAMGNIPERQEEALAYFNKALEVEKLRDNSLGIAMNYLSISDYYIEKKEYKIARSYLEKLKTVNERRNDDHGLAITDEFFGVSYLKEGKNYDQAISYFKMALEQFIKIKDVPKQAEILSSLAKVSEKQNLPLQSLKYYNESMALALQTNTKGLIMANAQSLANIYEKHNEPKKALKYLKIAQLYKDSIDFSKQQIEIASLTTNYDIEKKESRIELLENEKQLRQQQLFTQQEKIKRQQILFLLAGVLAIAILVISIMTNRVNKHKKKTALLLAAQEKERLQAVYERDLAQAEMMASRMQMNPHFLFNCLNAINYLIQKGENEKATKYLIVFSRFVRQVLETSRNHVVPLNEELTLIKHYLMLEENRFDYNFSYNISVNDEEKAKEIFIPPMLLQPFIENAILHGLLPSKKEKKELNINVVFHNNLCEIIIEDNGVGKDEEKRFKKSISHKSMGTKITQDRIDLHNKNFDNHIGFKTIVNKDENGLPTGTRVTIILSNSDKLIEAS